MAPHRADGGQGLYSTLSYLNFNELSRFTPEAFDWLYEDSESKRLLNWISDNLTNDNYVSSEQLDAYNQIPSNEILSGATLESALETAMDQDSELDLTNEHLEIKIAMLEAELGCNEGHLDTVSLAKQKLVDKTNTDLLDLDRLRLIADTESKKERKSQEQILHLNIQYNTTLINLKSSLERVIDDYTSSCRGVTTKSDKYDSNQNQLLCRLDLASLEKKENQLTAEFGRLVNSLFGTKFSQLRIGENIEVESDPNSPEEGLLDLSVDTLLEFVRGRDRKEFVHLKSEVDRLRVSIFHAQLERILVAAEDEGVAARLSAVHRLISDAKGMLIVGAPTKPIIMLPESVDQVNTTISKLVAECVSCYSQRILSTDYKLKYRRSLFIINKLKLIRDALLQRRARQEILDVLIFNETKQILDLINTINSLEQNFKRRKSNLNGLKRANQCIGSGKMTGSLILPQDVVFSKLHTILQTSDLVDPLATYASVDSAVRQLLLDKLALEEKARNARAAQRRNLERSEAGLRRLMSSLRLDSATRDGHPTSLTLSSETTLNTTTGHGSSCLSLVPKQISRGISHLNANIQQLEVRLKGLLTDWDRQKTELKTKPYRRQQRDLWVQFVLRPSLVAQNVQAVQNKAHD